jgi:hypothetical protein
MFRIEMLPAGHGDSLLITYGQPDAPHRVLIDGGPYYAFEDAKIVERETLANRLRALIAAGEPLELLVITHVDADHIEGAVKLLASRTAELVIEDVWFNGWRHLLPQPPGVLGPVQGEMLSGLIQDQGLTWNGAFDGAAVAVTPDESLPQVTLPGGMSLTLLSPTPPKLETLADVWADVLRQEGLDPDAPDEALARLRKSKRLRPVVLAREEINIPELAEEEFEGDDSEANGSSIAFVAEYDGKRCLFSGDAHPSVLEPAVRQLLEGRGECRLHLDAFKIPHHGSKSNISRALLELLACPNYLVSTNGNYFDHPDREAMARIIVHGGDQPVLHFNYRSEETACWDDDALKAEYGFATVYPLHKGQGLTVDL